MRILSCIAVRRCICYELCSGGVFCSEIYSGDLFCYALYFINVRTFVFTRFISSFYYLHYLLKFTMEIVCLIICYESTNRLMFLVSEISQK